MQKNIIQDVVPPRRSIRQIVVPGTQAARPSDTAMPQSSAGQINRNRRPMYTTTPPSQRTSHKGIWVVVFLAILFLYLTLAVFFAGAIIRVTPREQQTTINGSFIAKQNPAQFELPFETMTVSAENTMSVPATGEKYLEQKASGRITIYNDYGDSPLRLIKNTRFESPSGLVYRIANSIIVPPQEKVDGVSKPGMIDAEVYADTAGAEYNLESGLFTIPGLKDTPQYSGFYAKTKTPIAGGFDGMTKVLDVTKETEARTKLRTDLSEQLKAQAHNEVPEGFVFFDSAIYLEATSLLNTPTDTDSLVLVGEKVSLHGIIFNEAALATYIARNTIQNFDNGSVHIPDIKKLVVEIATDYIDKLSEADTIRMTITGTPLIV
ncbi:MAG: hypothetical protein G01um101448_832, partial [Parcubacteria group bacterium Gr01-1014_48]